MWTFSLFSADSIRGKKGRLQGAGFEPARISPDALKAFSYGPGINMIEKDLLFHIITRLTGLGTSLLSVACYGIRTHAAFATRGLIEECL